MFSPGTQGLLWCVVFVVLDAVQAVYFGNVLQRIDGFLLGGIVFGLSATFCVIWSALRHPGQFRIATQNPESVIGLNITAAGGWIFYLLAVQLIEPAVAFTIFAGSIPLVTIGVAFYGVPEGQTPRNRAEMVGNVVLAGGLMTLSTITLLGLSGFVRGGVGAAAAGIVLAWLAGLFITGMLLYGQRLDRKGMDPITQFGFRFPLFLILSVTAVLLRLDHKGVTDPLELAWAVALGLLLLAFPIYAVQKAISLTTSLTIGALAGTAPLIVFALQMIEGRVSTSVYTTVGLSVCFVGSMIGAFGAASERQEKPAQTEDETLSY